MELPHIPLLAEVDLPGSQIYGSHVQVLARTSGVHTDPGLVEGGARIGSERPEHQQTHGGALVAAAVQRSGTSHFAASWAAWDRKTHLREA